MPSPPTATCEENKNQEKPHARAGRIPGPKVHTASLQRNGPLHRPSGYTPDSHGCLNRLRNQPCLRCEPLSRLIAPGFPALLSKGVKTWPAGFPVPRKTLRMELVLFEASALGSN